jgi:hypothetical protein
MLINEIIEVLENQVLDVNEIKSISRVMSDYLVENKIDITTLFNEVIGYEYNLDRIEKILVSLYVMQLNDISLESLVY